MGEDKISNVVSTIESNTLASIQSIQQAVSQLNESVSNMGTVDGSIIFEGGGYEETASDLDDVDDSADNASSSVKAFSDSTQKASNSSGQLGKSTEEVHSQVEMITKSTDKSADSVKDLGDANKNAEKDVSSFSSALGKNTDSKNQNASASNNAKNSQSTFRNETTGAKEATDNFSAALKDVNTNLSTLSAGSAMYLAGQMSSLGTRMEDSAKNLNNLSIGLGQVAKMSGMAEGEMTDMITHISNETFPNDEAIMYTKNLVQMGVESKNFAEQATNMDRINDAFGLGAETTNSLVTELSVLGVDANNIASSFNALAYANENTKGGMENFYSFLRKYDSELHQLGYNTDQAAIIISAATQKFGGGRAALAGLSEALKEAGSDTGALESALNLKSGALQHASQETASYEGQLQSLADEQMEHKTILERITAFTDDLLLRNAGLVTLGQSIMGVFGQGANIGLTVFGLKEMGLAIANWGHAGKVLDSTIDRLKLLRTSSQEASKAISTTTAVNPKAMTTVNPKTMNIPSTGVGKNTGKVASETKQVVEGAAKTGAMAGPANTAGASMKATGTGLKSIGSGALSMVAPLLQISVAVMILLPVLALIAAEALLLLKGLQILVKALAFDKIDLTKSIEGIKQVGKALWEIGVAIGAMAVTSIITMISTPIIVLGQIVAPINQIGQMLVDVARELQIFNSINIDKSIPTKIKSLSDTLKLVSDAMGSLGNLSWNMAWGNLIGMIIGNVGDAVRNASREIINASNELDKIKDVPDLDKGAVDKLKKVGTALESVGKAMDGLRSIRDSQNFDISGFVGGLFGGANIEQALNNVKDDVYKASSALKNFDGVDTIPDGVGNNLKKVADALKSVGDSMEVLRKLRDDYNWDIGIGSLFGDSDVVGTLDKIKEDLVKVSGSLKSLGEAGGLEKIGDDVPKKIKKVTDTLDSVLKSIDKMNEFQGKGEGKQGNDFSNIVTTIDNARSSLIEVSKSLSKLGSDGGEGSGLATIGGEVKSKLKTVTKVLSTLATAINNLKGFPTVSGDEIPNRVDKAVTVIQNSARHMNNLNGSHKVSGAIISVISSVGKAGRRLASATNALKGFPTVSGDEIPNRVDKAVTVIQNSARHMNNLKGTPKVSGGIVSVINSVGKAGRRLSSVTNSLKGFPVVSGNEIPNRVKKAVTAVKNTAKQLNKLKGTSVKGGIGGILNSVANAVKRLRTTLSKMSGGFKTDGQNIGTNLKTGIKTGLNGLGDTVSTAVNDASGKANPTATTMGTNLGKSAVNGFKSSFLLGEVIAAEMSNGLNAITTATPDITNAMGALAEQMVQEFKNRSQIKSPGAIARAIRAEMGYMKEFVVVHGKGVVSSVGGLADNIVNTFKPNLQSQLNALNVNNRSLNRNRLNTLNSMTDRNSMNENNQRPVTIVFNEGAVQLDARNLTTQESRQVLLNAIEGLDVVESVNIKGA